MPTGEPWQKADRAGLAGRGPLPDDGDRDRVQPAVLGVSRVDIDRGGPTYTIDTLRDLRDAHAARRRAVLHHRRRRAGPDLHLAATPRSCSTLAHFVGVHPARVTLLAGPAALPSTRVSLVEMPALAISSTDCRERVGRGAGLVPRARRRRAVHRQEARPLPRGAVSKHAAGSSIAEVARKAPGDEQLRLRRRRRSRRRRRYAASRAAGAGLRAPPSVVPPVPPPAGPAGPRRCGRARRLGRRPSRRSSRRRSSPVPPSACCRNGRGSRKAAKRDERRKSLRRASVVAGSSSSPSVRLVAGYLITSGGRGRRAAGRGAPGVRTQHTVLISITDPNGSAYESALLAHDTGQGPGRRRPGARRHSVRGRRPRRAWPSATRPDRPSDAR